MAKKRLVVELASRVDDQLKELTHTEDANKTTVVNKAVQTLHLIRTHEAQGNIVAFIEPDGTVVRLTIL